MSSRRGAVPVRATSAVLALGLGLATAASRASPERDGTVETKAIQMAAATPGGGAGDLDVLFVIDDSSGMTSMQTKLAAEIPYASVLAGLAAKIGAHLQEGASDGGLSEGGAPGDGGGAVTIDAGPGLTGGGGHKGDAGDGSLSSPGQAHSGLTNGGCDVAAARPTTVSLGALLFLLVSLVVVRRRRLSARRSSVR